MVNRFFVVTRTSDAYDNGYNRSDPRIEQIDCENPYDVKTSEYKEWFDGFIKGLLDRNNDKWMKKQ